MKKNYESQEILIKSKCSGYKLFIPNIVEKKKQDMHASNSQENINIDLAVKVLLYIYKNKNTNLIFKKYI